MKALNICLDENERVKYHLWLCIIISYDVYLQGTFRFHIKIIPEINQCVQVTQTCVCCEWWSIIKPCFNWLEVLKMFFSVKQLDLVRHSYDGFMMQWMVHFSCITGTTSVWHQIWKMTLEYVFFFLIDLECGTYFQGNWFFLPWPRHWKNVAINLWIHSQENCKLLFYLTKCIVFAQKWEIWLT